MADRQFQVRALGEIAIRCSDMEKMVAFYSDIIGLELLTGGHRDDITFAPRPDRFDKAQLTYVLPADERHFDRWNDNPYLPDDGGDGTEEDNGSAWLLPYWMARYHGFITESAP